MKKKILIIAFLTLSGYCANSQVKVGKNPTTKQVGANLEVESANGAKLVVDSTNGRVGVNITGLPTSMLHVKDTGSPVRFEGLSVAKNADVPLYTSSTGVIKKRELSPLQNRLIVKANGGTDIFWNNNVGWSDGAGILIGLSETIDSNSAYDPTTSEFTAPFDGAYYFSEKLAFRNESTSSDSFNGNLGQITSLYTINGVLTYKLDQKNVYRGARILGGNNYIDLYANFTLSLKAGDKLVFKFVTFSSQNMSSNLTASLKFYRSESLLAILRL